MQRRQTRLAAVFAAMTDAGFSKSDIAKLAGVHRSQVSRWFTGETRPTYDTAMRLARGIRRSHPELADEFTAAAGYMETDPDATESLPPPDPLADLLGSASDAEEVRRKIRLHKGPAAQWYISALEDALREAPEDADEPPAPDAQQTRR